MILFFDRSVGTSIPRALREYLKPPGVQVEYHQLHFDQAERDDIWLSQVGIMGWIVIGQDYRYHFRPSELAALRQYQVGCFYLWGAQAQRWETLRVFARAYDRILDVSANTSRPFVYRVQNNGRLIRVPLP